MKLAIQIVFLLAALMGFSQELPSKDKPKKSLLQTEEQKAKALAKKAPINLYKIITLARDTTFVDTSLTIKDEYDYNFLRKDNFGSLSFANEGQAYMAFKVNPTKSPLPNFGFRTKSQFFEEANQINYYSVPTPLTELYFKTVMEKGQSLDALITTNTSERFNVSLSFKGLNSQGRFLNQQNISGNFRFTSNYKSKNKRYVANFHFTGQDILNGENGGIYDIENFISNDINYQDRQRLTVYLSDASSFQKGKRLFLDHYFEISKYIQIQHQASIENKFYEYNQQTIATAIEATPTSTAFQFNRFGNSFSPKINDQVNYKRSYNKLGVAFKSKTMGEVVFFADDSRFNQYYGKVILTPTQAIPSRIKQNLNAIGAKYSFSSAKWSSTIDYSKSLAEQNFSAANLELFYKLNDKNQISASLSSINKLPDNNFQLHQSSYVAYNWYNQFKNENTNTLALSAKTQWLEATLQYSNLRNHLYFSDQSINERNQIIAPQQFDGNINNISLQLNKEIKYGKFALDNSLLLQQTEQSEKILNLPKLVTRNTLYYSNHFFKRALFIQTGLVFNYFSKYNANDYNPILSEFYTQNKQQIGSFPMLDYFVNARIRQTRIFIKAEHFNALFASKGNYLTAPNYPYRDFIVRFGLVWNFFQ
jgi:Putative porin